MIYKKAIAAATLAAAFVAPAWAAPTLFAEIDRASFRHTVLDTDPADGIVAGWSTTWWNRSADVCSEPYVDGCRQYTLDPAATVTATRDVGDEHQFATAGPDRLFAEATGIRPDGTGGTGAEAFMQQHLIFSGAGRHTFEVDYRVGGSGFGTTSGSAQATLSVNGQDVQYALDELRLGPTFADGSRGGTLSLIIDVVDGQHGTLMTYAWATITDGPIAAPVPEPATWSLALMGAGLAAFGARRRRR
ncbi:PEP-CTERM sorting domain-containing protein [Rhizobacter sp. LjRoot28]|uniref:PEP-CTERM sorting domain-containing protein n=1 Tax=Rhizobacter sp. LjRoot28 TaxID=3342309 RepID=UPI003ECE03E0